MRSIVRSLRAPEDDWAKWQECADAAGLSFNAWAREALNSQVDLEKALARLEEQPGPVVPVQSDFSFKPDPKPGRTKKGR